MEPPIRVLAFLVASIRVAQVHETVTVVVIQLVQTAAMPPVPVLPSSQVVHRPERLVHQCWAQQMRRPQRQQL